MPLLLASINLAMHPGVLLPDSCGTVANFIIVLTLLPLLPFLLIIIEIRTMIQLENCQESQVKDITEKLRKVRKHAANFIRTEIGIENPLQLTFSILLLLFSISPTRIFDGLRSIFDEISNENMPEMPFNLPPEILLILTYIWPFSIALIKASIAF